MHIYGDYVCKGNANIDIRATDLCWQKETEISFEEATSDKLWAVLQTFPYYAIEQRFFFKLQTIRYSIKRNIYKN